MIRQAVRRLLRAPTFALAALMTLTLGIGAAAGVFTLIDSVLLRPMPYDQPDQLVALSHTIVVSGAAVIDQSDATYLLYRRDNRVFSGVGAFRSTAVNLGATAPEHVTAALTTASVFAVLRVPAAFGRALTDADDQPGAPPVVVIGQQLWKRTFGGDKSVIGSRVTIDGVSRQVVGVMPASFQLPAAQADLWIPLQLDPAKTKSAAFDYKGIARLRDGVPLTAAVADLARVLPHVPEVFPGRLTLAGIEQIKMRPVVTPLRVAVVGDIGRILWIVLGAVGLLLLIACANVANLCLARAEGRQRELAVRSALGAGRAALLAELLSDALVLATIGGLLGLAAAAVGVHVLKSIGAASSIPRLAEVSVNGVVFTVTGGIAALVAIIVSVLPLVRLHTASLSSTLLANGRAATSGRVRNRARRVLVVAQVALALMLVSGAGLFARSFADLRAVDPGFKPDHALAFRLALPNAAYPTTQDAAGVVLRTLDALNAVPGVQSTGVITKLPLDEESRQDSAVFLEDDAASMTPKMPDLHEIDFVTPSYFGAMGIPLLAGRVFGQPEASIEAAQRAPEVIVSAAFAARYWNNAQGALGKRVRMNSTDPWHTVVGVVGSVRDADLEHPPADEVYAPLVTLNAAGALWIPRNLAVVVRTSGDPVNAVAAVRRAVATVDLTLPLYRVMPVSDLVTAATARTTFTLLLLAIAAVMATTIGALGIYGVIAYLVSLRTREIGIRLALGADARHVRRLVTSQAVTDAVIGIVIGLVGAVMLTRVLGAVLFNVSPTDPATLGGAAVLLFLAAIVASWMPARHAASLDPASALRSE
ncbi:MAG TPA: ABC transporter permease [Gemmatimonadaceae bacterium]|jgi:predicted permease